MLNPVVFVNNQVNIGINHTMLEMRMNLFTCVLFKDLPLKFENIFYNVGTILPLLCYQ